MKQGVDYTGVAVVFACHDGRGRFLFAQRGRDVRDGQGTWEIPAGGVDFGESIRDGLYREIMEELGVVPVNVEEMGYKEVIQRENDRILKHWLTFEFLVQVDPMEVKICEPDKCVALAWHTLDDVPEQLHFGVRETIANVSAYLAKKNNN